MSIFTLLYGHFEQTDFSTEVKERLNGNPRMPEPLEKVFSLPQVQMFVKQTSLLLLPERVRLLSRAESLHPPPERQMDRSTSYPTETPNFKISESVSRDTKTHCPHEIYI